MAESSGEQTKLKHESGPCLFRQGSCQRCSKYTEFNFTEKPALTSMGGRRCSRNWLLKDRCVQVNGYFTIPLGLPLQKPLFTCV